MTRLFCVLLTLLFSLSCPALGKYSDFSRWSIAAKGTVADGKFYSVAYEMKLNPTSYPKNSPYMHFNHKGTDAALKSRGNFSFL